MPIKDIASIISQVTDHFGSDIFIPISTFSSHAQHGGAWTFIMKSPKAVSKYPFQSIRNVAQLDLSDCNLNGEFRLCTPILFSLTCLQYEGIGSHSSVKSHQYDSVTCFLYVLTGFCIPQVPFRLNWANWRIWWS